MRKRNLLKKARKILGSLPIGWNAVCEDESIFTYDAVIKKVWVAEREQTKGEDNGFSQEDIPLWFYISGWKTALSTV
jgi:hypothetical protein